MGIGEERSDNLSTVRAEGIPSKENLRTMRWHWSWAFLVVLAGLMISLLLSSGGGMAATEGDYSYTVSGSPTVATVTGYSGAGGAISIPATLGGYSTYAIGASAFDSAAGHKITAVMIPEGVRSIGDSAFSSCSLLTTVAIPNSVESIGMYAFASCHSLSAAILPGNLTVLSSFLFFDCSSLESISIPERATSILTYAFYQCGSLTSIHVPDNVTDIGYGAFLSCVSLTSAHIGERVAVIGPYAFNDCISLVSLEMGNNVSSIGMNGFAGCTELTALIVPAAVTSIGAGGFAQCSSLTRMQFDGDAPSCGILWIEENNPGLVIYYRSGATGFSNPWHDIPTVMMTLPLAPQNVTALAGDSQIALSWTAPASDGGSPIVAYSIFYGLGAIPDRLFGNYGPGTRFVSVSGLQPGIACVLGLRASNGIGASAMSEVVNATPFTVPGAPSSVAATAGTGMVTISWERPTNDGGRPILNYSIFRSAPGSAAVIATVGASAFSFVDTNVTAGTTYLYCITAINIAGQGASSSQVSIEASGESGADMTILVMAAIVGLIIASLVIWVWRRH
jgi:hypothetical protein